MGTKYMDPNLLININLKTVLTDILENLVLVRMSTEELIRNTLAEFKTKKIYAIYFKVELKRLFRGLVMDLRHKTFI